MMSPIDEDGVTQTSAPPRDAPRKKKGKHKTRKTNRRKRRHHDNGDWSSDLKNHSTKTKFSGLENGSSTTMMIHYSNRENPQDFRRESSSLETTLPIPNSKTEPDTVYTTNDQPKGSLLSGLKEKVLGVSLTAGQTKLTAFPPLVSENVDVGESSIFDREFQQKLKLKQYYDTPAVREQKQMGLPLPEFTKKDSNRNLLAMVKMLQQSQNKAGMMRAAFLIVVVALIGAVMFFTLLDQDNDDEEVGFAISDAEALLICQEAGVVASFCVDDKFYVRCDDDGIDFEGDDGIFRECDILCNCPANVLVLGTDTCEDGECIPI